MPTNSLPLRDIHLPLPIGMWPLAPEWWVVFAVLTITVLVVFLLFQKKRRVTALKQALMQIDSLFEAAYIPSHSRNQKISEVIKQLAITIFPEDEVAGLTGKEWVIWLNNVKRDTSLETKLDEFLIYGPYNKTYDLIHDEETLKRDIKNLLTAIDGCQKKLKKGCRNPAIKKAIASIPSFPSKAISTHKSLKPD